MEEEMERAIEYANGSTSLENLELTSDETAVLISAIKDGKTEESFVEKVVKLVKASEENDEKHIKN